MRVTAIFYFWHYGPIQPFHKIMHCVSSRTPPATCRQFNFLPNHWWSGTINSLNTTFTTVPATGTCEPGMILKGLK